MVLDCIGIPWGHASLIQHIWGGTWGPAFLAGSHEMQTFSVYGPHFKW